MRVPNYAHVVKRLHDTNLFNLTTHDGLHAFVDAVIATLNGVDERWRHLKKSAAQTHISRHGEDAALWLLPDNKAQAVDFVIGARGPNPQPGWNPDPEPFYTHADAHDPDDHGIGAAHACPPAPVILSKGEAFARLTALNAFYAAADGLQRPGGLIRFDDQGRTIADMEAIAQWFYQMVVEGVSLEDVFTQIRSSEEWRSKHP